MNAFAAFPAGIAAGAGGDLFVCYPDFFDIVSAVLRAAHKFVAQQIGIAAFSRTARQNQNLFAHIITSILFTFFAPPAIFTNRFAPEGSRCEKKEHVFLSGDAMTVITVSDNAESNRFRFSSIHSRRVDCRIATIPLCRCQRRMICAAVLLCFSAISQSCGKSFCLRFVIFFIRHRLEPFSRRIFSGNFDCQVRKPAVPRRSVPMLNAGDYIHHISG